MLILALVVDFRNNIVGAIDGWDNARATFYGDIHGGETMRKYIWSTILWGFCYKLGQPLQSC